MNAVLLYGLLAVFVVLQLADVWTTRRILAGGGRELNPVMRTMFDWFGVPAALAVTKVAACLAVAAAALGGHLWIVAALDVLYLGILIHNSRELLGW